MRLGLNRRNVGRLVLVAWAVALAWLARRELYSGEAAAVALGSARIEPGGAYFAVVARGRQIGQMNITVDTLVDGVRVTEILTLDLSDGDSTRPLARRTDFVLSRSLQLRGYTAQVFGGGSIDRTDGVVGGDSILTLTTFDGEARQTGQGRFLLRPDAVLAVVLPFRVALGGRFRNGERFVMPVFDAITGTTQPASIRITAESTFVVADSAVWDTVTRRWTGVAFDTFPSLRLEYDVASVPTVSWAESGGTVVAGEIAGGVRLERAAFEMVRNNYRIARRGMEHRWRDSLSGARSLAAVGPAPRTAATEARFLVLHDSAANAPRLPAAASGGRQQVIGDTILVLRHPPADTSAPPPEAVWHTPDLPMRDSLIGAALRRALGRPRPATRADSVRRLTEWVARQVATDPEAGSGSALAALRTRKGSPDAKARLLVTLARAGGIPARVANGLAIDSSGALAHSWAELWVEGWHAADPTYGQYPASTALVRITTDRRSRPLELFPLVASARFLPIPPGP